MERWSHERSTPDILEAECPLGPFVLFRSGFLFRLGRSGLGGFGHVFLDGNANANTGTEAYRAKHDGCNNGMSEHKCDSLFLTWKSYMTVQPPPDSHILSIIAQYIIVIPHNG